MHYHELATLVSNFKSPRLSTDPIILRGGQHEAQGQLLAGIVVLCLHSPLRVEEVSLELLGTVCHS